MTAIGSVEVLEAAERGRYEHMRAGEEFTRYTPRTDGHPGCTRTHLRVERDGATVRLRVLDFDPTPAERYEAAAAEEVADSADVAPEGLRVADHCGPRDIIGVAVPFGEWADFRDESSGRVLSHCYGPETLDRWLDRVGPDYPVSVLLNHHGSARVGHCTAVAKFDDEALLFRASIDDDPLGVGDDVLRLAAAGKLAVSPTLLDVAATLAGGAAPEVRSGMQLSDRELVEISLVDAGGGAFPGAVILAAAGRWVQREAAPDEYDGGGRHAPLDPDDPAVQRVLADVARRAAPPSDWRARVRAEELERRAGQLLVAVKRSNRLRDQASGLLSAGSLSRIDLAFAAELREAREQVAAHWDALVERAAGDRDQAELACEIVGLRGEDLRAAQRVPAVRTRPPAAGRVW